MLVGLATPPAYEDADTASRLHQRQPDLANDLGNLVKRTTDMTSKFLGGTIPAGAGDDRTGLRALARDTRERAVAAYRSFDLSGALGATWDLVRRANQVVQETKPWELAKDESRRHELAGILAELLEAIRIVAHLLEPAMPEKAKEICRRLGRDDEPAAWASAFKSGAGAGWKISPGDPVFPRIDRATEDRAPAGSGGKPDAGKSKAKPARRRSSKAIAIDDFQDVELVVATIRAAERVEGADRLLKLRLDLGNGEERQVVSGIADHFAPEELPGRQVVLVANLKPAKIRGIESQGMILVAQAGGKMTLLGPGGQIESGAKIS